MLPIVSKAVEERVAEGIQATGEGAGARPSRRRRRRRRGRGRRAGTWQALASARLGIRQPRPEQVLAIESVLAGQDTFAVLPTGYGKSLIYQVPALMRDRPTIVVSPLIALMADQERMLRQRRAPVVRIDSSLKAAERREALARLEAGGTLIVLTTPETLQSESTRPIFERARPALLCVDEAHCISEWGHDFRPSYLRLGEVRRALGSPPLVALTATATPRVREEIVTRLGLAEPFVVVAPPYRENLELEVEVVPGNFKTEATARLIRKLRRPGIVYCATTTAVDQIWRALVRAGIPTARYHGKMASADRAAAQRQFMEPNRRIVMVATSAFGMGIDKPNIRYVVHYHAPASLEQYVQEAGRAGRDGEPARCILLFDPADQDIQQHLQMRSRPNVSQLLRVAKALAAWGEEQKVVTVQALALSAQIPATTCAALAAQLEAVGLIRREGAAYAVAVGPEALAEGARDLAGRLETLRREDARRLASVAEYAGTAECRSVFIRRYFGEEDPPRCGKCDRDRVPTRAGAEAPSPKRRRRSRRRRG